jgi:hypothetical protein
VTGEQGEASTESDETAPDAVLETPAESTTADA